MSPPAPAVSTEAASPDRAYVTLTFLQWLPVGLTMAPFVLLLLDRGLSLAQVSLLGAVSAVTVTVCELPTGGLADSLGRKPVLVASALFHATGLMLLGVFSVMGPLLVAAVLLGLSRALASGPLEAWYVDRVHAAHTAEEGPPSEPAPLTSGLARGEVASSVGLGVGTVLGGGVPLLAAALTVPGDDLAVPVLLAAAVELVRSWRSPVWSRSGPRGAPPAPPPGRRPGSPAPGSRWPSATGSSCGCSSWPP
jgi:MFS family permease